MRVLLVSFIDNNEWTGMGKWSHRMAEGLSELGYRPTTWFANDFPTTRRSGQLSVLLFPCVLAVALFRHRKRFDVVVIHEPSGLCYAIFRRVMRSLPPMIAMCHNVESKVFRELSRAGLHQLATIPLGTKIKTHLFRLWQSDGAIRLADQVVCLSTVDQDYVIKELGCHPEKVTRLTNGVDREDFTTRSRNRQQQQRILFVGGWLDVKGRQLLPAIWSQVHTRFPQARLTMIGTGLPAETVLHDFALPSRATVTVIPRLPHRRDMRAHFAANDAFLMPSLSEGSPLSLLEAMAAMLPVVATRVGGIPDIITHAVDGLLFDPMDSETAALQIWQLLDDTTLASRIGCAAQKRVRHLTWMSSARMLEKALARSRLHNARETL